MLSNMQVCKLIPRHLSSLTFCILAHLHLEDDACLVFYYTVSDIFIYLTVNMFKRGLYKEIFKETKICVM